MNLAMVMLLGGLWHGSSWNFVIWGAIHGGMLAFERMQGKDSPYRKLPGFAKVLVTYVIVLFTWVFFRAADLESSLSYCGAMLGTSGEQPGSDLVSGLIYQPYYVMNMVIAAVVVWLMPQTWDFTRSIPWWKAILIAAGMVLAVVALTTQSFNPFIYFIF